MLVDVRKTKTAKAADIFIQIKPRRISKALWTLRALAKGVELDPDKGRGRDRRAAGRPGKT